MTDVLFYHLHQMNVEAVLPTLVEKALARGWRVVIEAPGQDRIAALDARLWTFRDDAFVPHGLASAADAADQPVLLTNLEGNANGAQLRILLDGAPVPSDVASYERVLIVFNGDDDDEQDGARAAWRACREQGLETTYWQADESGRWQRMG